MSTPGPGHYNIGHKLWVKELRKPIPIICFIAGGDVCRKCEKILMGDYHKGKKSCWCHECYSQLDDRKKVLARTIHVRHCSYYHQHIGVPNIISHTKTLLQLKKLQKLEIIMFRKFGMSID